MRLRTALPYRLARHSSCNPDQTGLTLEPSYRGAALFTQKFPRHSLDIYSPVWYTSGVKKEREMRFNKSPEYNEHDGSWWLTSDNAGPIEVVIKVQADKPVAKAVAAAIEQEIVMEWQPKGPRGTSFI